MNRPTRMLRSARVLFREGGLRQLLGALRVFFFRIEPRGLVAVGKVHGEDIHTNKVP